MNRFRPHSRVIAHRGGGALAPENTLAGLRTAKSLGFSAVEFDVMLTADCIPILMHDETLQRTAGDPGEVAATPYSVLSRLDAGGWFSEQFRGERIPAFADAARLCRELGLWANVEIKPAAGHERATGATAAELAAEIWGDSKPAPLLSSFHADALDAARAVAPHLPRGFLSDQVPPDWREPMQRHGCVSLHCNHAYLTEALARDIIEAGYALMCYTVNDPEVARRLFSWGVDAVFTDRLDAIAPGF